MNVGTGIFLAAVVAVVITAIATKPSFSSFEHKLRSELHRDVIQTGFNKTDDFATGLFKFGCKLSPKECVQMIRTQLKTGNEVDFIVGRAIEVRFQSKTKRCVGAFRNWWCASGDT